MKWKKNPIRLEGKKTWNINTKHCHRQVIRNQRKLRDRCRFFLKLLLILRFFVNVVLNVFFFCFKLATMCSIFNNIFGFCAIDSRQNETASHWLFFFFLWSIGGIFVNFRMHRNSKRFCCSETAVATAVVRCSFFVFFFCCCKRINILSVGYWNQPHLSISSIEEITSQAQNSSLHHTHAILKAIDQDDKKKIMEELLITTNYMTSFLSTLSSSIYIYKTPAGQQFSIEYSFDFFNPFCISASKSTEKLTF